MRLVCPNCEAKYEVPEDAIPDTGRDVQCTNCGHTWFQMRGRVGVAAAAAPVPVAPSAAGAEPEVTPVPAPEIEPEIEPVPEPVAEAETAAAEPATTVEPAETAEAETVEETVEANLAEASPADEPEVAVAVEPVAAPEGNDAAQREAAVPPDAEPAAESMPAEDAAPLVDAPLAPDPEPLEEVAASAAPPFAAEPVSEPDQLADVVADVIAETSDGAESIGDLAEAVSETVAEPVREAVAEAPVSTYAVDESVLAILREEAEREANARRAEALESQTDLGIDAAMPRKGAAVAEVDTKPSARRDLLPDVEEINSTLRPSEMQADADGTPDFVALPPEAPRGFRSGFLSLMTIAILGAALYLAAPRLALTVPALAGPLEIYVSLIDSMRLGLDGMMRSATVAISDG